MMSASHLMIDGHRIDGPAINILAIHQAVLAALEELREEGLEDMWIPLRSTLGEVEIAELVRLLPDSKISLTVYSEDEESADMIRLLDTIATRFAEDYGPQG